MKEILNCYANWRLNRTFMELKFLYRLLILLPIRRLNRTFMELKYMKFVCGVGNNAS